MTSRSQRFGPRIGGWRDRSSTVVTEQRFTNADIAATPYLAIWRAPNGVSTQWMVLALDDDDAKTCAKLRAAHLGYDTKGCYVDLLPMPRRAAEALIALVHFGVRVVKRLLFGCLALMALDRKGEWFRVSN